MIIVTGATGQLGHAIVAQLLERVPATHIGVSVRDPSKVAGLAARDFAKRGVRVRRGDYEDAESLRHAFEGASQVLMISSNAAASGGDPVAQHRTAIDAAKAAGVRRIVYTSQISASPTSAFNPGVDHGATEALLRASGVPFTALRNGFYASHALGVLAGGIDRGEIVAPEDGKFSWTAHADLAEAAAVLLCDEGRFEGATPPLTGSEALDFADLAALASEITGREVRRITVTDDAYVAKMIAGGMPANVARFLLGMFVASRRGEFAAVDPTLEKLVGRAPITVRALLAAKLAA
jgi:NAD(P)H dehydrogenase (quinone)